jgi:TP901 family phage tail tape measure protein
MARATDLLTDAQSALGLSTKNVVQDTLNLTRVSDVLVKANTLANASVEQFSIALTSKAGSSLKAFSKDVEEGVAVLAAFADQGVKAELAGNQLDRVIRLLSKSSMDNAAAHEELGFKVFDSAGKMRNMGDIIENLEGVLSGMSDQQKVVTLDMLGFQARVQQAILPLLGTSQAIKYYEAELRNAGGTTALVAEKQMKSFSNQMKMLWNQVQVAAIAIGEDLVPVVQAMSEKIQAGLRWWKGLDDSTKSTIAKVALLVAATGPLLLVLGTLAGTLSSVITIMTDVGIAAKFLTIKFVALRASTMLLGTGIAAGVVGVILITKWLDKAGVAAANLSNDYQELARTTHKTVAEDKDKIIRLGELAKKQELTTKEAEEARRTIDSLTGSYGDFGIKLDDVNGKIEFAADSFARLSQAARAEDAMGMARAAREVSKNIDQVNAQLEKEASKTGIFNAWSQVFRMRGLERERDKLTKDLMDMRKQIFDDLGKQKGMDVWKYVLGLKGVTEEGAQAAAATPDLTSAEGGNPLGDIVGKIKRQIGGLVDTGKFMGKGFSTGFGLGARGLIGKMDAHYDTATRKWKEHQKHVERAKALAEEVLTPQEKYNKKMKELTQLSKVLGPSFDETFKRQSKAAKTALDEATEDRTVNVDLILRGVDAVAAGSAEALARAQAQREMLRGRMPGAGALPPGARVGGKDDTNIKDTAKNTGKMVTVLQELVVLLEQAGGATVEGANLGED